MKTLNLSSGIFIYFCTLELLKKNDVTMLLFKKFIPLHYSFKRAISDQVDPNSIVFSCKQCSSRNSVAFHWLTEAVLLRLYQPIISCTQVFGKVSRLACCVPRRRGNNR